MVQRPLNLAFRQVKDFKKHIIIKMERRIEELWRVDCCWVFQPMSSIDAATASLLKIAFV